jgi:hypothetical protein
MEDKAARLRAPAIASTDSACAVTACLSARALLLRSIRCVCRTKHDAANAKFVGAPLHFLLSAAARWSARIVERISALPTRQFGLALQRCVAQLVIDAERGYRPTPAVISSVANTITHHPGPVDEGTKNFIFATQMAGALARDGVSIRPQGNNRCA